MIASILQIFSTRTLRLPQFLRTIIALIMREMATSYGRSPGGYLWAVAEPAAGIALLTFIFSLGFQAPPIGSSFALFYASGLVPFLVYTDVSNKVAQSINYSAPLLSYPRVTIADAILARTILNSATQAVVTYCVMLPLIALIDTQARVDGLAIHIAIACAICLGFGVGTMNCFLITRFPVWQRLWSIINRPMFLLSCVVFTFSSIPMPYRDVLWFNPIVHLVGIMRSGLYFGYDNSYASVLFVLFISAALSCTGLFLIWLFKDHLLNR